MKYVITALANVLHVSQRGALKIRASVTGTCNMVAATLAVVSMSQNRLVTWVYTQLMYAFVARLAGIWSIHMYFQLEQLRPWTHSALIDWVAVGSDFYCHWLLHVEGLV